MLHTKPGTIEYLHQFSIQASPYVLKALATSKGLVECCNFVSMRQALFRGMRLPSISAYPLADTPGKRCGVCYHKKASMHLLTLSGKVVTKPGCSMLPMFLQLLSRHACKV